MGVGGIHCMQTEHAVPDAIAVLYDHHHGWLRAWLRKRLGNSFDAADLAHDTFVRILGRQPPVQSLREPRAWLTTIARGLVIDQIRRQSLERACIDTLAQLPEAHAPSPESLHLLVDTLAQIDALLDGLSANTRMAFLMSRLDGLTYPEIAHRLHVSLSSVEKYMATAFRHCLALRSVE